MFTQTLLHWFDEHQRVLPWRGTHDPYQIWVSEIILQQTRVAQGWNYYLRFIQLFPTIAELAAAPETEVLKAWQGLGYYSRARNMHAAAQSIVDHFHGEFPCNYQDIRKLKGIGDYTAAAIASFAFQLPYPAVDGNVLRFVARYVGIFDDISLQATKKKIAAICAKWLPAHAAGTFNQAMIEMGAIQCTALHPDCENCPFSPTCYAFQHQQIAELPVKQNRTKIRDRYFHYIIYLSDNQTIIQQRTENDIWKGLYEFPLIETAIPDFNITEHVETMGDICSQNIQLLWKNKQVLSHQNIFATFYLVSVAHLSFARAEQLVVEVDCLPQYAVSKLTERAIALLH